jgi:CheY-like chemotaxis protein
MLAYAGQRPLQVEYIDLSQLVSEMRQLVTSSISGRTKLDLDLASNLPMVEVEAAQIAQVVMNLITNAVESLGDGKGSIRLETGEVVLEAPPSGALFADTMKPGRHVFLRVTDTGAGMDDETRLRIFDPFYTTKFTGRGLGLAAVAGIVRSHSGAIEVESEPGRGTSIRVLLPARGDSGSTAPEPSDAMGSFRTHGIALVIDDDEDIRLLAEDVLQRCGMTVLTAADGHEGVKLFAQHADEIRVVLLDRTMPLLSGSDALEAIRSLRPEAPIVVVSGYSKESVETELRGRPIAGFLQKPFAPETLVARVRAALEPVEGS